MDEQSRLWPVFIEVRDAVRAALAPPIPLQHLIRRGRRIAQSLAQGPRTRKMQRSMLKRIFKNI